MEEEQLNDLKQFIAATVSQQTTDLHTELSDLRKEMREGFAGVADTMEKSVNVQLDDHEQRIIKLEEQAA
jgi:seryl-tRNA synthetase